MQERNFNANIQIFAAFCGWRVLNQLKKLAIQAVVIGIYEIIKCLDLFADNPIF
jgi:hypothetical protein